MSSLFPQPESRASGSRAEALVCAAAGFTTLLDSAVLGIGIPAIRRSLDAGTTEVQWILASYSLTFGLALVPAGRLGDVIGRRRFFLCGLAVFSVMGLLGATAADPWALVAARLGQGLGAGVVSSQVLGIITDRFTGRARARALGAYSTAGGLAGMCGPVLGGAVLGFADPNIGWRILLMSNVPFAAVTLVLAAVYLTPDHTPRGAVRTDAFGLFALAVATLLLLLPLVSSMALGFSALSVAASGAVLIGFWLWERRLAARGGVPVLLPELLARRGYVLGTLVAMFWFGAILALNAVLSLYLIEGLGFSALRAALVMAGSSVMMAITSAFGWRLVSRFGRVAVVAAVALEFVVVACYIGAVDVLPRDFLVAAFVLLSAVSGIASGLVDAPNRGLTLEYAPIGASGVAAAFLQLSQRLSATISLAAVSGIYLGILGSMPGR